MGLFLSELDLASEPKWDWVGEVGLGGSGWNHHVRVGVTMWECVV